MYWLIQRTTIPSKQKGLGWKHLVVTSRKPSYEGAIDGVNYSDGTFTEVLGIFASEYQARSFVRDHFQVKGVKSKESQYCVDHAIKAVFKVGLL